MPVNRTMLKLLGRMHKVAYRLLGGRVVERFLGAQNVLLTTTGRKSGKPRTTPLLALRDGDDVIVVASYGGNDMHPQWYRNLRSNPAVEVQVGRERRRMRAEQVSDEEKSRLWPRIVEMYAGYAGYQQGTERNIPVVRLRASESKEKLSH